MCLAIPMEIKKIEGDWAVVESGAHRHKVNLSLVKDAKEGDYVLVHGDMAINKLEKEEAKKILEIINKSGHHEQ